MIEHTIFNYIESTENLKTLAGYPLIDSEKDELYYVNKEWIKPYTSCILSWVKEQKANSDSESAHIDKVAQWKKLNESIMSNDG